MKIVENTWLQQLVPPHLLQASRRVVVKSLCSTRIADMVIWSCRDNTYQWMHFPLTLLTTLCHAAAEWQPQWWLGFDAVIAPAPNWSFFLHDFVWKSEIGSFGKPCSSIVYCVPALCWAFAEQHDQGWSQRWLLPGIIHEQLAWPHRHSIASHTSFAWSVCVFLCVCECVW